MKGRQSTNKTKILFFDLDGTLVDSKRDIILCVNRALSNLGLRNFEEDRIGKGIGNGSEALFYQLLGQNTEIKIIKSLQAEFSNCYLQYMTENTAPYPGVIQVLEHYRHIPKFIVTNKSQALADQLVERLGLSEFFEGVYGYEAFATRKPDPGPILEVCMLRSVPPSETVFIGDSPVDIVAGRRAGARTVAALYGYGDATVIRNEGPTFEIHSAGELMDLF